MRFLNKTRGSVRRAFTLIELLVVIAIIAILAAILFPVFAQAKNAAKGINCVSNLKNISLAWMLYQGDYDDGVVPRSYAIDGKTWTWHGAYIGGKWDQKLGFIYPYMKNAQIKDCPSATETVFTTPAYAVNYAYIYTTYPGPSWTSNRRPINMSAMQAPSETIIMADAYSGNGHPYYRTQDMYPPTAIARYWSGLTPNVHGRHAAKTNVAWFDGHAKTMPITYQIYADPVKDETYRNAKLGYITKGPWDPANDQIDYYYQLTKEPYSQNQAGPPEFG